MVNDIFNITGGIVSGLVVLAIGLLIDQFEQNMTHRKKKFFRIGYTVLSISVVIIFLFSKPILHMLGIGEPDGGAVDAGGKTASIVSSSDTVTTTTTEVGKPSGSTSTDIEPMPLHQDKNLTDLRAIKYSPFSDLHFNESIEVDNKLRPNSIYYRCKECANQAQLQYNISGEWKRLDLHVGFSNKTPNYDQSAVFIVRINGKEVFNEEVKKGEGMKEISLDVSKVNDIEFLASTNSTGDWADLVWVSPKISN